jgi:hypothetical protein
MICRLQAAIFTGLIYAALFALWLRQHLVLKRPL